MFKPLRHSFFSRPSGELRGFPHRCRYCRLLWLVTFCFAASTTVWALVRLTSMSEGDLSLRLSDFVQIGLIGALVLAMAAYYRNRAFRIYGVLSHEQQRLQELVDTLPHGLVKLSPDGTVLFVNPAYEAILGEGQRLVGSPLWCHAASDADTRQLRDTLMRAIEAAEKRGSCEAQMRRTDGAVRTVRFDWACRATDTETVVTAIATDITDFRQASRQLRESERKYRSLFDQSLDGILLLGSGGRVIAANPAACRILDQTEQELIRKGSWPLFGGDQAQHAERLAELRRAGYIHAEWGCERTDNSRIIVEVSAALFESEEGEELVCVVFRDITDRKAAETQLAASREELRLLSNSLQKVQEAERQRIARELHDELGQYLTAVKLDVKWIRSRLTPAVENIGSRLDSIDRTIDMTVAAVRRMAANLRPVILDDLGLTAACEWLLQEFQQRTGIDCQLSIDPEDFELPEAVATTSFRVIQEALTNISRHAQAQHVDVRIQFADEGLSMLIADDGVGMPERQPGDRRTLGLVGMRERVHALGGTLAIDSAPGEGTRIHVQIPASALEMELV